jgi:hypothetical protein
VERMQGDGNVQTQGVLTSSFRFRSSSSLIRCNSVVLSWTGTLGRGTCGKRKLHAFSDRDHAPGRARLQAGQNNTAVDIHRY